MQTISVVECYRAVKYFDLLSDFDKKLGNIIDDVWGEKIDYSEIVKIVSIALDQIHLPCFVTEFDLWYKKNEGSCYQDFFKTSEGQWIPEAKMSPEFISKMAKTICESTLKNIKKGIERLRNDSHVINEYFDINFTKREISIRILDGDRHEGGMQPLMLTVNGKNIIYKPRSSRTEGIINSICCIINFYNLCPKTLDRGEYCWQEFITNNTTSDLCHFHDVYENYGVTLAIAVALNLNDCHFDNFIVDGKHVRLIDSETCFQFYGSDIERSILQTGLLQSKSHILDGMGHTSAITAIDGAFTSFCYPYAINDKTSKIQIKYEKVYTDKKNNYPHFNGVKPKVSDYISDVQRGFKKSYLNLKKNKEIIAKVITNEVGVKSRYLVRATAYYLYVINKILLPEYYQMGEAGIRKIIIDYLIYDDASDYISLIDYEMSCLLRYDVPIFYIYHNSRNIMDGDGRIYQNFFPDKPIKQIYRNLNVSDDFIGKQISLINECMKDY